MKNWLLKHEDNIVLLLMGLCSASLFFAVVVMAVDLFQSLECAK